MWKSQYNPIIFVYILLTAPPAPILPVQGGAVSPKTAGLLRVGAPPLFTSPAVSQRPHDEAENECSSSRGNGYGTLPPPGWQWKNCPSPVAPLEPKVFESMDQKRSLERSEGAHPQQSEETCFPPAIASKGLPKGAERSRQLGRVTRHRPPGPLRVQRLAADHCRKREPVLVWRPDMYWPAQTPSAHRGPWSTRHNRNLRRQSLYSPKKRAVFPTKRIFCQNSPFLQHSLSKGRGQGIQSPNGQVLIQKKKVHGSAHLCMIGLHEEPSDIGIKTEMDLSFFIHGVPLSLFHATPPRRS